MCLIGAWIPRSSKLAQRAPHHDRSVGHGVAWRWNGASSVPWEWRRGSRARVGGLVVAPCQHGEGTYGTGVAARLAGAAGQQWLREAVGARGGVGTADSREAVAATDVGRGGGGVLGVAGRVAWAQGRGIGEERKEEDGSGIYMPRPFTPGAIPPPGVKVLYLPLLPVGNTHRE